MNDKKAPRPSRYTETQRQTAALERARADFSFQLKLKSIIDQTPTVYRANPR